MNFIKKTSILIFFSVLHNHQALCESFDNNQNCKTLSTNLKLFLAGSIAIPTAYLFYELYNYMMHKKVDKKTEGENSTKAVQSTKPLNKTRVFKFPKLTCRDIGGYTPLKKQLMDTMTSSLLSYNDNFLPRVIFLYGDKGVGKATLVEAVTGELGYHYGECNAEQFLDDTHFSFGLFFDFIKKTVESEKIAYNSTPRVLLVNNFIFSYSREEFEKSLTILEHILKINNIPLIIVFSTHNPYVNLIGDLCQSPYCHFFFMPLPSYEERIQIVEAITKNLDISFDESLNSMMVASLTVEFSAYNLFCLLQKALYIEAENKKDVHDIKISLTSLKKAFSDIHRNTAEVLKKVPEKKSGVEYHLHTYAPIEKMPITFGDVIGHEQIKDSLKLIIEYLKNPKKFIDLGIKAPKGVILSGAPGTGKTFLAKALANEAGVPFFFISGSDFVSLYIGVGANNIRELFKTARAYAPCIIFIDEIDAVAINRKKLLNNNDSENRNTLNELLYQIDGFKDIDGIVIIAATNMIEEIDPALMRPGRLELHFNMPQLTYNDCEKLLSKLLINKNYNNKTVNLEYLARKIKGFTGADITYFINLAATMAMMRNSEVIEINDFDNAYQSMTLGNKINNIYIPHESLQETAIHEVGHCFCALAQKHSPFKLDMITIEPRDMGEGNGAYLGANIWIADEEELKCYKYEELLSTIVTSLGGYVAEQLFLNTTTSGVSNDLLKATRCAYRILRYYGMGDSLNVALKDDMNISEADRVKVEEILQQCKEKAKQIILANKEKFNALVRVLLERKTMFAAEVYEVVGDINYV